VPITVSVTFHNFIYITGLHLH